MIPYHGSGSETEDRGTDPVGPVCPYVKFDQVQPVAERPVGPYITLSPVGSTEELDLVGIRGKLLRIDIKTVVMTDEPVNRSGTDGSSTACPVYLPDAVYINKTLIARACVVNDYQEIGAMASHESENLTENPKQPVVEPIRHIH